MGLMTRMFRVFGKRKNKRRKITYAKVIRRGKQHGKSDARHDSWYRALSPGKRRSHTGKIYYETRKNRSDVGKWY